MGIVTYKFFLDDVEINPPVNWQSTQILATFDQSSTQANISTDEFEFVNESAQKIRNYLLGGLDGATRGIFEGIPFQIFAVSGAEEIDVFDGYLDFNSYEEINPTRVKCKIKKTNGLNSVDDRSRAVSFGYLESINVVTPADYVEVQTIAEKLNIESDLAMMSLALFMLSFQIFKSIADINKELGTSSAIVATATPTSIPAGATNASLNVIIEFAYLTTMIIAAVKLIIDMKNLLVPPIIKHKGMRLRTMMEKASSHLGYTYDSPLTELDDIVYLPSKPFDDKNNKGIKKGIPNATDFGYILSEAYELINKLTNSKIQVTDSTLTQRSLNDPFWVKNATYQKPDVLDERVKYNNADFTARTFLTFATDNLDDWTVDNFKGTNYEIVVTPIDGFGSDFNLMRGLDDVALPMALGTPKDELNVVEEIFLALFTVVDVALAPLVALVNLVKVIVPGFNKPIPKPNFAGIILDRLGVLKVSQKNHSVAKLLYMDSNGLIPRDEKNRNLFSAKVLWNKYYNYNSFVSNSFGGQRRLFIEQRVPFGFSDFQKLIENSYFVLDDGRNGKVESIKWELDSDFAVLDYWVEEVYTENLKEEFIEG